MSFIKTYASLAALMLRPAGGTGLAGDGAVPASRGAAAAEPGRAGAPAALTRDGDTGTEGLRNHWEARSTPPPLPLPTDVTHTARLPLPPALRRACAPRPFI